MCVCAYSNGSARPDMVKSILIMTKKEQRQSGRELQAALLGAAPPKEELCWQGAAGSQHTDTNDYENFYTYHVGQDKTGPRKNSSCTLYKITNLIIDRVFFLSLYSP